MESNSLQAWRLDSLSGGEIAVSASTLALMGVLYCFLGYRLIKFVLAMSGFLLASLPAALLAGWISQGQTVALMLSGLIGGLCGAVALLFLYQLGVFALGGFGAGLAAHFVLSLMPQPWTPWAVVGLAFMGGLLALWLERPIMCLATSAIGAWLLVSAVFMTSGEVVRWMELEDLEPQWFQAAAMGLWVLLLVLGLLCQRSPSARERQ